MKNKIIMILFPVLMFFFNNCKSDLDTLHEVISIKDTNKENEDAFDDTDEDMIQFEDHQNDLIEINIKDILEADSEEVSINDSETFEADEDINNVPEGTILIDCAVPCILDGSKMGDMAYISTHIGDLIQEYCISGIINGVKITDYPEKMYFGMHLPSSDIVSLTQISMSKEGMLIPEYTVKIDIQPDSSMIKDAEWLIGYDETNEKTLTTSLLKHMSDSKICLFAYGYTGKLKIKDAKDTTLIEGGSFTVTGKIEMVVPQDIEGLCTGMAGTKTPCCE